MFLANSPSWRGGVDHHGVDDLRALLRMDLPRAPISSRAATGRSPQTLTGITAAVMRSSLNLAVQASHHFRRGA